MSNTKNFQTSSLVYINSLSTLFTKDVINNIEKLAHHLLKIWREERNVFICGNGGSAANAIHIANDFHYGVGACGNPPIIKGLKVEALTANSGILTCLSNDIGYENIFSHQIETKANKDDLLIVLSGSGNSENICKALKKASEIGLCSYAILGFSGVSV